MKKIHHILIAIVFVFLFNTCKKSVEPPSLPPITQIGANTFGCKINGRVWVPHYTCTAFGDPCGELEYTVTPQFNGTDTSLFIFLRAGDDSGSHYFFQIGPMRGGSLGGSLIKGIGNYADSISVNIYGDIGDFWKYDSIYVTTPVRPLYPVFNITTIDATKRVVAGTFAFKLFSTDLKDSLIITDGRFDLKFGDYCRCSQ